MNRDELFSDPIQKYLGDEMRRAFGYEGCPIVLVPKARPKTIEPVRKFKPPNKNLAGRMDAHRAARHERYSRKPKKNRAEVVPTGEFGSHFSTRCAEIPFFSHRIIFSGNF